MREGCPSGYWDLCLGSLLGSEGETERRISWKMVLGGNRIGSAPGEVLHLESVIDSNFAGE